MSIFSDIFRSILGGVGASSSERATKDATKEAGKQNRLTAAFQMDKEYYLNQKLRHEKARAASSNYGQFSTVRSFAPNYQPGTGLDALPADPKPEDYK